MNNAIYSFDPLLLQSHTPNLAPNSRTAPYLEKVSVFKVAPPKYVKLPREIISRGRPKMSPTPFLLEADPVQTMLNSLFCELPSCICSCNKCVLSTFVQSPCSQSWGVQIRLRHGSCLQKASHAVDCTLSILFLSPVHCAGGHSNH